MKITKAVITCAGFGTRLLPISKTIQKEMLPVLNKPVVDYVVEDCIKAGIREIIFVINQHNYQVLHYYRQNNRLKQYLAQVGKAGWYQRVADLHQKANFHFIKQADSDPYGTAVPIKLARNWIQDEEAFLYLTGDDFVYSPNPDFSLCKKLIELYQEFKPAAILTCDKKAKEELNRYGVVKLKSNQPPFYLQSMIEKPKVEQAPSNLVNISKYILPGSILRIIDRQQPNPKSGELYITDSLQKIATEQDVLVHATSETYLDGGSLKNWLKANLTLALQDKKLRAAVLQTVAAEGKE